MRTTSTNQSINKRIADLGSVADRIRYTLKRVEDLKSSRDHSESFDSVETFIDLVQISDDLQEIQTRIHRKIRATSERITK